MNHKIPLNCECPAGLVIQLLRQSDCCGFPMIRWVPCRLGLLIPGGHRARAFRRACRPPAGGVHGFDPSVIPPGPRFFAELARAARRRFAPPCRALFRDRSRRRFPRGVSQVAPPREHLPGSIPEHFLRFGSVPIPEPRRCGGRTKHERSKHARKPAKIGFPFHFSCCSHSLWV